MIKEISKFQIESFFKYVAISSESNPNLPVPSSKGQLELAEVLAEDLKDLGLINIVLNENAIVTALLPANIEGVKSVGFVAHLDTVNASLSPDIKPQIIKYEGKDIVLNEKENIVFRVSENIDINKYMNEDIIFSDGTSVLGADDKAAIATIITTLKYIKDNNVEHGDIHIAFVPDEEGGLRGSRLLDLNVFSPNFAYTIDCCEIGEVVYETFNAGKANIDIEGVTAHPMSAKGVLVNSALIAVDILNSFDRTETPECTEEKEGFIYLTSITGNTRRTNVKLNIRDHDLKLYEEKKKKIKDAIENTIQKNTRAKIEYQIEDVYSNIANFLGEDRTPVDLIYKAMENKGIEAKTLTMRGGTDGSVLSSKGLLTPNYFTGAHNFHSPNEFLPISSFYKSFEVTLEIIKLIAKK